QTTGEKAVNTGTFYLSETGGLTNYSSSAFTCFNDNGDGTGGIAHNGIQDGTEANVAVGVDHAVSGGTGDDVVCSITNTRTRGAIELQKVWSGTPGQTTLQIGTSAGGSQTAS